MKIESNYKLPLKGHFKISFFDENMNLIKSFEEQNLIVASARDIMPLLMVNQCVDGYPLSRVGMIELGWGGHMIDPNNPSLPIPNAPQIDDTDVYKPFSIYPESGSLPIRFRIGDTRTPGDRAGEGIDPAVDDSTRNIEYFVEGNKITYKIVLTKNDTQLNGKYISECGLFTMDGWDPITLSETPNIDDKQMFAHKCFGGFQKTSDFIVVMEWSIIF